MAKFYSFFFPYFVSAQDPDGSWKLCVDYCTINKETMEDKFFIPMIDELLEELFGSTIFQSWICYPGTTKSEWKRRILKKPHTDS